MDMRDVIEAAGGVTKLAAAVGRHHSSVLGWDRVPIEHVMAVSTVTGISARELRPDVWTAMQAPGRDLVQAATA